MKTLILLENGQYFYGWCTKDIEIYTELIILPYINKELMSDSLLTNKIILVTDYVKPMPIINIIGIISNNKNCLIEIDTRCITTVVKKRQNVFITNNIELITNIIQCKQQFQQLIETFPISYHLPIPCNGEYKVGYLGYYNDAIINSIKSLACSIIFTDDLNDLNDCDCIVSNKIPDIEVIHLQKPSIFLDQAKDQAYKYFGGMFNTNETNHIGYYAIKNLETQFSEIILQNHKYDFIANNGFKTLYTNLYDGSLEVLELYSLPFIFTNIYPNEYIIKKISDYVKSC